MKTFLTLLAGATLALTGTAASAARQTGEEKLATMLEGRVAGEPRSCISAMRSNDLRVLDRVGVVYDAGETVWVARADRPESIRDRDVLIIDRTSGANLCRQDVRLTVDRTDGFMRSVVMLGDFVPYTRADARSL